MTFQKPFCQVDNIEIVLRNNSVKFKMSTVSHNLPMLWSCVRKLYLESLLRKSDAVTTPKELAVDEKMENVIRDITALQIVFILAFLDDSFK